MSGLHRRNLGADSVSPAKIIPNVRDSRYLHARWPGASPVSNAVAGYGDPTGATGDLNFVHFQGIFGGQAVYHIKGAGQTILAPSVNASTGFLDAGLDLAASEGVEYIFGGLQTAQNPLGGTVDSPTRGNMFGRIKMSLGTAANASECAVGFRLAESAQANLDDYNDLVCINVQAGVVNIETIVGGAATVTTAVPIANVADDDIFTLECSMKGGHPRFIYTNITQGISIQFEVPVAEDLAAAVAYVPFTFFLQSGLCGLGWNEITFGDVLDDDESLQF